MPTNDSFAIPRKTQKITTVVPTTIVQFAELVGNLPNRRKFADRVPKEGALLMPGQAFKATKNRIKAIGAYLKVDFRAIGQRRSGAVLLRFYHWGTYGDFTTLTQMTLPVSGKPAEVGIDITQITNLNETIFEFEESMELTVGDIYFFTITQPEGYDDKQPIFFATSAYNYGNVLGDYWLWDTAIPTNSRRFTPATDFVFQAYVSITELSVEIVGSGSGNLTGIQNALTINTAPTTPQAGFGVIDYNKPFQTHGNAVIDPTTVYGDAPITTGPHAGFSAVADLNIPMFTVGAPSFLGTGLNDLTAGTTFTGLKDLIFVVTIASVGPPDTFDWSATDVDGNVIASATGVAITGLAQTLTAGVTITFAAVGGHTVTDRWTFYVACWDFAIVRVATDRIRMDWGDPTDTLDCGTSFRLLEEGDAIIIPEYVSQFSFRKHSAGDSDPTVSITLWRTDRPR